MFNSPKWLKLWPSDVVSSYIALICRTIFVTRLDVVAYNGLCFRGVITCHPIYLWLFTNYMTRQWGWEGSGRMFEWVRLRVHKQSIHLKWTALPSFLKDMGRWFGLTFFYDFISVMIILTSVRWCDSRPMYIIWILEIQNDKVLSMAEPK